MYNVVNVPNCLSKLVILVIPVAPDRFNVPMLFPLDGKLTLVTFVELLKFKVLTALTPSPMLTLVNDPAPVIWICSKYPPVTSKLVIPVLFKRKSTPLSS